MSWGLSILACTLACLNVDHHVEIETISLRDHHIRVADVVDLTSFELKAQTAIQDKIILSLPPDISNISISRADIATHVRRRVPRLDLLGISNSEKMMNFEIVALETLQQSSSFVCSALTTPRFRGQVISGNDIHAVNCRPDGTRPKVIYDKSYGVVRAGANLTANSYLGRLSVPQTKYADEGDELLLRVQVGPVTIEKPVWALQPSNDADRIFVVDSEGTLMRVPVLQKEKG